MAGRTNDLPDLPTLTVAQAAALLEGVRRGDRPPTRVAAVVFVIELPPAGRTRPDPPTTHRPNRRGGLKPLVDLAGLRKTAFDALTDLRTFYLIGCAYRDGLPSLRAVAREFERRDQAQLLPKKIGTSVAKLSKAIHDLELSVFPAYFSKPSVWLLQFPEGEGTAGVPSEDGWRAWEATRRFLTDYYELPAW